MFARVATVFTFLFVILPALTAAAAVARTEPTNNQCNVGPVQCCNSVQQASNSQVGTLAGLLGVVLGPITGQVGLGCSPLSVVGAGGNSCSTQPVCCTDNNFNGLLVIGCTPINL